MITVLILSLSLTIKSKNLQLVSIENLVEQDVGRLIMREIYTRTGIEATIEPLPGKRAQAEVETGRRDGEIMRIFDYGEQLKNVIRVETPYYQLKTMVFKRKINPLKIESATDLSKYKIVVVRGVKHTELITKGLKKVYKVKSTEQMMKFLKAGRADIAITSKLDGEIFIKKENFKSITQAGRPLAVFELYHYLLKEHKEIALKIDQQIKVLKKNGELKKIISQAENRVIKN